MRIRSWLAFLSLWMILAVLFSGCLGVKTPPVSRQEPPAVFLDYQRTGGFAGVSDRVVIFDNGVTLISTRQWNTETTFNTTELDRIGALFNETQFAALEGNYTSRRGGADMFHYSVSYHGKTVHTEDMAIPPELQPVIDEMNQILLRYSVSTPPASHLPDMPS